MNYGISEKNMLTKKQINHLAHVLIEEAPAYDASVSAYTSILEEWASKQQVPQVTDEPKSYVCTIPDHCDRYIWRGYYYQLSEAKE